MLLEIILFILGLVLLILGSEEFVEAASKIAKRIGVSEFIIGLTLIAVGTSLPELASSITASLKGSSGLITGNLIGSNIANIGLIIGLCAIIAAIKTKEIMLKRDGYIMLFVSFILLAFAINGMIGRIESIILILIYFAYVSFLIKNEGIFESRLHFKAFVRYLLRFEFVGTIAELSKKKDKSRKINKKGMLKYIIFVVISLAMLILGAKLLVDNSLYFSQIFGISETFIGLAIVAIGTSLPELAVSISAIRKGFNEMVIGNIIGSNVANITLIFGISALISPVAISTSSLFFLIPSMILFSALLLLFIRMEWKINRIQGIMLLVLYALFLIMMAFVS